MRHIASAFDTVLGGFESEGKPQKVNIAADHQSAEEFLLLDPLKPERFSLSLSIDILPPVKVL
jgi:hypothetical protein